MLKQLINTLHFARRIIQSACIAGAFYSVCAYIVMQTWGGAHQALLAQVGAVYVHGMISDPLPPGLFGTVVLLLRVVVVLGTFVFGYLFLHTMLVYPLQTAWQMSERSPWELYRRALAHWKI